MMKGSMLDNKDRTESLPVVVISRELARQGWPGQDPLGKRVRRVRTGQTFPWMTVVGVVGDVKEDLFNYRINRPVWYLPYAQVENNFPLNLVVRANSDPAGLTAAAREAIRAVDREQQVSDLMSINAKNVCVSA